MVLILAQTFNNIHLWQVSAVSLLIGVAAFIFCVLNTKEWLFEHKPALTLCDQIGR